MPFRIVFLNISSDTQSNPACNCFGAALNKTDCCKTCNDVLDRYIQQKRYILPIEWYHGLYYYNGFVFNGKISLIIIFCGLLLYI
jgi:hypothetical protein